METAQLDSSFHTRFIRPKLPANSFAYDLMLILPPLSRNKFALLRYEEQYAGNERKYIQCLMKLK